MSEIELLKKKIKDLKKQNKEIYWGSSFGDRHDRIYIGNNCYDKCFLCERYSPLYGTMIIFLSKDRDNKWVRPELRNINFSRDSRFVCEHCITNENMIRIKNLQIGKEFCDFCNKQSTSYNSFPVFEKRIFKIMCNDCQKI